MYSFSYKSHLYSVKYGTMDKLPVLSPGTPESSPSLPEDRTKSREGTALLLELLLDCYDGVNTETRRYGKREQLQHFSIMLGLCRGVIVSHASLLLQGCFQYLLPEGAVDRGVEELYAFMGLDRTGSIALLPSGFLTELVLHVYQVILTHAQVIQPIYMHTVGRRRYRVQSNVCSSLREVVESH